MDREFGVSEIEKKDWKRVQMKSNAKKMQDRENQFAEDPIRQRSRCAHFFPFILCQVDIFEFSASWINQLLLQQNKRNKESIWSSSRQISSFEEEWEEAGNGGTER